MNTRRSLRPWLPAFVIATAALGVEWGRALSDRNPSSFGMPVLIGGVLLCLVAAGSNAGALGFHRRELVPRLLSGAALGAILLLPTAARSAGGPPIWASPEAPIAFMIAFGEEVAFRGALFNALSAAGGAVPAIVGSSLVFTAAHVLSHPPAFLVPVAATGLLLGTWRWMFNDLVAPVVGHCIADLCL